MREKIVQMVKSTVPKLKYAARGECCPPRLDSHWGDFINNGEEYGYIFKNGEWVCYDTKTWSDSFDSGATVRFCKGNKQKKCELIAISKKVWTQGALATYDCHPRNYQHHQTRVGVLYSHS